MTRICLIAETSNQAQRYANSQNLDNNQWFYARNANDLLFHSNFHVIVIGTPSKYFEELYKMALERGRIGRF